MDDKDIREKFSKVLGAPEYGLSSTKVVYSWEEIFCEIGKLQERANRPIPSIPFLTGPMQSADYKEAAFHFHNGMKCYQNPCLLC